MARAGRNVSEPLARSHWPSPRSPSRSAGLLPCRSRAEMSLADQVAGDVGQRFVGRHAASAPPDDDGELRLEVERVRRRRADHRVAVADDGVGELGEEHRPGREGEALLQDVARVVLADADDLARLQRRCRPQRSRRGRRRARAPRPGQGRPRLGEVLVLAEEPPGIEERELLAQAGRARRGAGASGPASRTGPRRRAGRDRRGGRRGARAFLPWATVPASRRAPPTGSHRAPPTGSHRAPHSGTAAPAPGRRSAAGTW